MSTKELFCVNGKKGIVTGASRGLGRAAAEALMENGARVVLWSTRALSEAVSLNYVEMGYEYYHIAANLGDPKERDRGFNEAMEFLGGEMDFMVNAAGIQRRHQAELFPMEDFNEVIEVNLTAVFDLCQKAGRIMIKNGYGKIINFASLLSYFGGYTVPAYAASKGGVMQLTKALSNEWASLGVNVNAIAPGYMDTEMNTALINDDERNREILARIPAKRWGKPCDIAGTVLFLASEASDYINGTIIPVDGGYLGR